MWVFFFYKLNKKCCKMHAFDKKKLNIWGNFDIADYQISLIGEDINVNIHVKFLVSATWTL